MSPSSPVARVFRFGIFEADLVSGELRKNGSRLRLQEQPFQLLTFLLERPGEVVTREDLRQKLWSNDTFVDFDHSLNTAVNKLREALGDSASSPRFVETVARRGYRFLAAVERIGPQGAAEQADFIHPELQVPVPHRMLTRGLFALIQVMYLIFYLEALFHWSHIERLADAPLTGGLWSSVVGTVFVTACIGIPLRCYLLSAVGFDYKKLGEKFQRIFLFVLAFDQLWAVAPLLIADKIGLGAAFAATAALLYVPFSERTLVRLAYPGLPQS